MNRVELIGRLGSPVDVKIFESTKMATISIATDEGYKGQDGNWIEKTAWHRVAFFRKSADLVEKVLQKGDLVYVTAKLTYRKVEKDGRTDYITNLGGNTFKRLHRKNGTQTMQTQAEKNFFEETDGGLPF